MVRAQAPSQPPRLASDSLQLDFDPVRGVLTRLDDLARKHSVLTDGARTSPWRIVWNDDSELLPEAAKAFESRHAGEDTLELHWSQFEHTAAPDLQVVARVTLDASQPVARWRISVENLGKLVVRTLAFPRIANIAPQKKETFAVPQWIGESTTQLRKLVNPKQGVASRHGWDYPGILSMQFMALYGGDGHGLLLSTNDTQLQRKQFAVFGDGSGGLGLEVVHFAPVERAARQTYAPPYDVELRAFDGDWFTAAEHYRRWANDQWWVTQSRVRTGQTPAWARDTALWVWNRGPSPEVLAPAAALQQHARLPVSVFWHWWHGCAYDVGFPEYLPPREGADKFREAVADANARDIHAIVYMNQRLWGMTTRSWVEKDAAKSAVKQPDGAIQPEVYNTFMKAACASMCMGTPFWRNTYAELAEAAVRNLGVAGIYMDQACSSLACYDPSHGHPLGGGTYWMEGFQSLEQDIRRRTREVKPVVLAGEGCGEGWLPHLDLMLSLQVSLERYAAPGIWEPLPLFNAVYHDCATQYGNYSSLTRPPYDSLWPAEFAPREPLALLDRKFSTQFRLEQARSFVWGQQPTIANFRENHLKDRAEEIDYLLRIARLRSRAIKYLRDGVLLAPPRFDPPTAEIPISRLSIYAGQRDAVQEYKKRVPLVLASAWRAPDGDVALVVASIADHPLPIRIELTKATSALPESGVVYRLAEEGRTKIATFDNSAATVDPTLDAYDLRIYEFKKE